MNEQAEKPVILSFYQKYRVQIWAAVFTLVGAAGGNVDRIDDFLPELPKPAEVQECQCNTEDFLPKTNAKLLTLQEDVEATKQATAKITNDISVLNESVSELIQSLDKETKRKLD